MDLPLCLFLFETYEVCYQIGGELLDHDQSKARRLFWPRVRRYGPLIAWMAFIFFASTGEFSAANTSRIVVPLLRWLFPGISDENLALAHFMTRKAAHFTEYAILAWLAALAFATSSRETIRRHWFYVALTLVILYALTDEYHQTFVQTRTGSIYDSFIDMAGGLVALLFFVWRRRRRMKTRTPRPAER